METTKIALFKGKKIRKTLHNNEWWFSVVDVCGALTDSIDAGAYWRKLKQRLKEEGSEVVTFCHGLKLEAPDGKKYETDCANTESIFRQNLRDHMNDFELIFTMLGERATTEIHRNESSKGMPKLKSDAKAGGNIAGGARKQLERRLGRSVVSHENYLKKPQDKKLLTK